jgi:NodT family efflux transporter outer membrane factor (OMF) lipoprotein
MTSLDWRSHLLAGAALALLLPGCAVGPDYHDPAPPATTRLTPAPLPTTIDADGQKQTLVQGRDIPGDWWHLYQSPALDAVVRQALAANPTLDAAQAALRQARENTYAQQGAYYPSVSANFSPSRNKTATGNLSPNSASGSPYYNLTTAQVAVSFTPDVFGANRRAVESLDATAESQRYQLEATYLTLTSNVVAAAIQEASLREQIAVTQRVIDAAQEGLRVLTKQNQLGQVGGADLYTQQAVLAQAQATMPTLQKQLAQQRDMLAALTGRLPDQPPAETFTLADLHLPADLPVSLPSSIVAQRPDILQASENARAASAQIGVAIANRIPAISLTANIGSSPGSIDKLFTSGNGFFSLAGSITQPIFQGGTLLHRQRAAEAAFDQAQAQYRSAVLTGLQNVADALHAVATDGDAVQATLAAEQAAAAGLKVVMVQLRLGAVSYLAVVTAETTELNAALALAQARANRLSDAAALVQALGGGWWNRSDVQMTQGKPWDVMHLVQ